MKKVLVISALAETGTGLALLTVPSLLGQLLLGEGLAGVAMPVGRVTGIALLGFGVACWPGPPVVGLLIYSSVVTLYLAYVGLTGQFVGILLWPAVAFHAVLSILLSRVWLPR